MRHLMYSKIQTFTQKSSFILEFSTALFVITFLQVAVFGHYYQPAYKKLANPSVSFFQEEDLQASPLYEKALKEIIPFSHFSFQEPSLFLSEEGRTLITTVSTPLLFIFNNQESFSGGMSHNFFSKNPEPATPDLILGTSLEEVKVMSQTSLVEEMGEEKEAKPFSASSTRAIELVLEIKRDFFGTLTKESSFLKNELINGLFSEERSQKLLSKKSKFSFKPFYAYEKQTSRLLNYWLQRTAPNENVPLEEIPFREGLIKTFFSKDFHPNMNEGGWFADSEEDEKAKGEISRMHEEAFYEYLRSIDWGRTKYKTLFYCPQVYGDEDFHQAKEDAFLYAYNLVQHCAPGLCIDEDFIVR